MWIGTNADPARRPSVQALVESGLYGVRFPVRRKRDYRGFVRSMLARRMDVLPIITNEWLTEREIRDSDWAAGFRRFQAWYPWLKVVQVGNEEDHVSDSSEDRSQDEYSALLRVARDTLGPDYGIVVGGAASGQPWWFESVDLSPANVMAVHPYAKDRWTAPALLRAYQQYGLPIWVTEFGATDQDFGMDGHARAVWYSEMLVAMSEVGVERAYPYCWWDRQHPVGFGLLDVHGNPKEVYAAVVGAL